MKKLQSFIQTRVGFLTLLTFLFTIKTIYVEYVDFNLGLSDPYQHVIMWLSPIACSIILLSIGLYFSKPILAYIVMLIMDGLNTVLLFSNVLYYRQFSDFLTVKTILNVGKVSQGLGKSSIALLQPADIIIWLDLIIVIALLLFKVIKIDKKSYGLSSAFATTSFGLFFLTLNLVLAESSRPRLLRNTFDRVYVVKYLGLDAYTAYDGFKSAQSSEVTRTVNTNDLTKIIDFTQQNYVAPNPQQFGVAKDKNVIVIHLESFQQFLINLKVNGHEVTPFLNSLYRDKNTLSYANFFHQVGLGRTSDAENMLETGTFGLPDGPLFTTIGSTNTFQAAPQILRQSGYTSAVFHGNVGSFWNRSDVYKNLGYNYFFDKQYYSQNKEDAIGYGLKDKLLFAESIKYLEQVQQPFYTKFITVTNHIPFNMDQEDLDPNFQTTKTNDQTVNNYFQTAHYLDQSLKEFFDYLNKSGLINNTMVVIYGDHYGLSNSDNEALAPVLGKKATDWTTYNNIQMQKVPFMIHMPGLKGGVQSEYAGEIDVLPTLLHLLGVNTKGYVQFGSDMLSPKHRQIVIFRNGAVVTPKYIIATDKGAKGAVYDTKTGKELDNLTKSQIQEIEQLTNYAKLTLHYSDTLNNRNLLRFYTPYGFIPDQPTSFNYKTEFQQMLNLRKTLGDNSTSLYSQHKGTTTNLYVTDAPELQNYESEITTVPENVLKQSMDNTNKEASSKSNNN